MLAVGSKIQNISFFHNIHFLVGLSQVIFGNSNYGKRGWRNHNCSAFFAHAPSTRQRPRPSRSDTIDSWVSLGLWNRRIYLKYDESCCDRCCFPWIFPLAMQVSCLDDVITRSAAAVLLYLVALKNSPEVAGYATAAAVAAVYVLHLVLQLLPCSATRHYHIVLLLLLLHELSPALSWGGRSG